MDALRESIEEIDKSIVWLEKAKEFVAMFNVDGVVRISAWYRKINVTVENLETFKTVTSLLWQIGYDPDGVPALAQGTDMAYINYKKEDEYVSVLFPATIFYEAIDKVKR